MSQIHTCLEDWIIEIIEQWDYYKGFGKHEETNCILMQIFAELIFNKEGEG